MYFFLRVLDKILYRSSIYRVISSGLTLKSNFRHVSRDDQDNFVIERLNSINNNKKKMASVSAVYRVKNGETFIESSILSIAPLVTEIIFVDNGSSDSTLDIVTRLKQKLAGILEIQIIEYKYDVALAGEDYLKSIQRGGKKTLSEYYNYSFSQAKCEYLIKADAHYIFSLEGLHRIQMEIAKGVDVIYYRGTEVYGKNLSVEPHCFKRSINWQYIDSERFEILRFSDKDLDRSFIWWPVFLHLKRIAYAKFINGLIQGKQGLYSATATSK